MDQRLNVLTLGVDDVPRATEFYERLGWTVGFTDGDIVMFQAGPDDHLAVEPREARRRQRRRAAGTASGAASPSATRSASATEVDASAARRSTPGRDRHQHPATKGFGYSGVFADPDGHTWEVALVEALVRHDDGTVALPS